MENFQPVNNFSVKHFVNSKNLRSFAPHLLNKRNASTTNEFFKCIKPS